MTTTNERASEKEPCPRVPSARRDPDGFCTAHGWECADFNLYMQEEEGVDEEEDDEEEDDEAEDDEAENQTEDTVQLVAESPVHTPDDPRFPEIEIDFLGHQRSPLSIISRVQKKMREHDVDKATMDEFHRDVVTAGSADEARHRIMCWVFVTMPDPEDD